MKTSESITIDSLFVSVSVEHPRRRGRPDLETISVQVHSDSLWLWDEECQFQSEIYLFKKRDPRFGRHLTEIPHLDAIHRAIVDHAVAQRTNLVGAHLRPAVQELDLVIAERDGSSVYFADAGGQIKIGWSKRVSARLAQLQTGSAAPIKLIGTMPGGLAVERRVHEKFAHLRLSGEWFTATPELLEYVSEVAQ
jgi:DNA-binding transcriptional ArsR family regulator